MRFGAVTFVWASPFATSELGVLERIAASVLDFRAPGRDICSDYAAGREAGMAWA